MICFVFVNSQNNLISGMPVFCFNNFKENCKKSMCNRFSNHDMRQLVPPQRALDDSFFCDMPISGAALLNRCELFKVCPDTPPTQFGGSIDAKQKILTDINEICTK